MLSDIFFILMQNFNRKTNWPIKWLNLFSRLIKKLDLFESQREKHDKVHFGRTLGLQVRHVQVYIDVLKKLLKEINLRFDNINNNGKGFSLFSKPAIKDERPW